MNQRIKSYGSAGLAVFWVVLMLLSLRFGYLDIFSYSALNASTQGIDFFSLPKAFLNLLQHRSMYDSWGGAPYGPYSTWFISHPAFGLIAGFWFSFFAPWTSYWLFVVFSLAVLACSARALSTCTDDPLRKSLCYPLLLCSFPVYGILHTGNSHAVSVLGLSLILAGLYHLAYRPTARAAYLQTPIYSAGCLFPCFPSLLPCCTCLSFS